MAFFNVAPTEKVDRLTETFDKGFNTVVRTDEAKPDAFTGVLDATLGGVQSGFNRSKYNLFSDQESNRKKEIAASLVKMRPDPKTVGSVGQFMFGVAEPLSFIGTQFLQDPITSVLAPSTLAMGVAKDYEPAQTQINIADGMDAETAAKVARTQATGLAIGTIAPASLSGGLLTRVLTGGALNVAVGAGERAETGRILRANGYEEMAKQYSALDGNAALAEFVLGGFFGGAFGSRGKARLAAPESIEPSHIDAALTANQSVSATVDAAPGVPVDAKSAKAHAAAFDSTIEALAFGNKPNVESLLTEAGFLGKRPDFNAVAIIREELEKAGFDDVAAKVRELETAAKERGLHVDGADLNVVLSENPADVTVGGLKGRESAVKIGNDYVPTEFRLVEAGDVRATMDKADNQYRDRTRVASEQQIQEAARGLDPRLLGDSPVMDFGAPVMTADGKIIAGNGRAAFIERAYDTNAAESYRSYLKENAAALGLNASEIDGMARPVLVRVLQRDVDVNKAAILSNEGGAMGMSALEQAKVDGERLGDFRAFEFGEDGAVGNVGNMPFIRSWVEQFPTNQRSRLMDSDGMLSAEGSRRLQNAIMYRAYGDSDTLSRLIEATDPGSRNIVTALSRTAARVADAKEAIMRGDLYPHDLSEDLLMAVEKYDSIRKSGMAINTWVNQIDGFGDGLTGEARALVVFLDKNIRSARTIADEIDAYYQRLEALGDPKQGSMFEAATPTKQDVFQPMLDADAVAYSRMDQTETPQFKAWAGTDKPVIEYDDINNFEFNGEGPFVLRAYHGTTNSFDAFDASVKGNMEGQYGAVNYFTSSEYDASENYAGMGPDLTSRIESKGEQLSYKLRDEFDELGGDENQAAAMQALKEKYGEDVYSENLVTMAKNMVAKDLDGGNEKVLEVFIKTERPFVVGGEKSPWLEFFDEGVIETQAIERVADNNGIDVDEVRAQFSDYEDEISDARYEILDDQANPLIEAVQTVADRYEFDPMAILSSLYEMTGEGSVSHTRLESELRNLADKAYIENPETGDLISSQVVSDIIQELGFDSIILKDADVRFKSMSMDDGTAHIHVFDQNNTNIKSATDNSGAFDPADPRINYSRNEDIVATVEQRIAQDFDGAVAEYAALPDSAGGRILNTDLARELSPDYRADRTRSAEVHEPVSAFVKKLYAEKLSRPTPEGYDNVVLFTAGGTGAGKTTGINMLGSAADKAEMIYDTNMNRVDSSKQKIDQAIEAGREIVVIYVHRDPVDALVNGALPRAMRMGRTVPVKDHAATHAGVTETIPKLMELYANDSRVSFVLVDNSLGKGNAQLTSVDKIRTVEYNGLQEKLNEAAKTEYEAGRISEAVYRGTVGSDIAGVRPDARGADAATGRSVRGQPQSANTVESLTDVFRSQFGKDASRLIEVSRVAIVQSVTDLPARADAMPHPSDVGAMYDPRTGVSYVVADNTSPSQIRGRILHEIGVHAGMKDMLGDALYLDVLGHVDAKIASGDARFIEARRRAEAGGGNIAEETLAYLVEKAPEIPMVRRILAAVRQWLYRTTGGRYVDLNTNDLVAMASASLRRQAFDASRTIDARAASVNEFYNTVAESDTIATNDNPLPDTMIPTGDTMEPIALATAKADAEIATSEQMQPGYMSAVECALVAGE
jgi:hypothetical protein